MSYLSQSIRKICCTLFIFLIVIAQVFTQTPTSPQNDIERRVESILSQLTLEEKIDLLGGVDGFYIRDIPRLNLPRLKMADGPLGVRNYGPATAMAGGIALAATWDPELAQRVGTEIGRDARAKGVHFLLGPGVNIYRAPMNGRNFEYLGEDPYLASRIAVGYINGVQSQGVSATIKHYMGNNSEYDRHNVDSMIDERTMREIYLPVFEAAVKEAHVGAVMNSYNLTNGEHMTQNGYLNNEVLKKDWGFDGVLMSDWSATYDGVAAANNGLDLEMPSGRFLNRQTLLPAVQSGKVSVATIDDKVRRILRLAIRFGWLDREQTDSSIPRYNQQGRQVALQAAREGTVLLKNTNNLLPLDKGRIKSIAVIGPNAYPALPAGGGSAQVVPFAATSFMEGISNYLGTSAPTFYNRGLPTLSEMIAATKFSTEAVNGQAGLRAEYFSSSDLQGTPVSTRVEPRLDSGGQGGGFGALSTAQSGVPDQWLSARWTGYYTPQSAGSFDVFAQASGEDSRYRVFVDDKLILDAWQHSTAQYDYRTLTLDAKPHKVVMEHFRTRGRGAPRLRLGIAPLATIVDPEAKKIASKSDVVVVAAGFNLETEEEGDDRTFQLPIGQDQLIQELLSVNKNVIVVLTSGGGVDMRSWVDKVPAILQAWYPGQEGGTALAEILFGAVNPSGKLPVTFEEKEEDNPTYNSYYPQGDSKQVKYSEGIFVGYRGYEHNGKKPLFPFGYGLSYTKFGCSKLSVLQFVTKSGSNSYWGTEISFDITNSGKQKGAEVAEIYVGDPHSKVPRPEKELKSFTKVELRPGETKHVKLTIDGRAFSYYDVNTKRWVIDPGDYEIMIGRSADQIELKTTMTVSPTAAALGAQTRNSW